jgi:HAE1 family hydrophobic/amphiphilic exporter-1
MKEAENELRRALEGFEGPQGVQDPNVSAISINDFPVISLSITGEGRTLEEITQLVESEIKHNFEGIDGVGTVTIAGQQLKEVLLTLDHFKMASLGVSEDMVRGIIQGSVLQVPLGLFELGQSEKAIVVDGNITSIQDLENIIIPMKPTSEDMSPGSLQLKDIAEIQVIERAESISRTNGMESIGINITKAADANTVDVVNAVKSQVEQIKEGYSGIEVLVMLDQGEPIEESVKTMLHKALFGALFALIVILLFLRNIRTTIISIISIPLSLVMTLLVLKQMDITLNIMTLGAMTVAIGRVVDDSIVVIENNYRRMQLASEKLRGKALILDATREMFKPILSSTLVTIAVFLPLGTVSGPIGQIFMPFALTMVFALLASLLVAITIVPMMTHLLFKNGIKVKGSHDEKPGAMGVGYQKLLKWTLNHKIITSSIAVLILAGSLLLVPFVGVSFLPEEEQKYAMISYSPGPGELLSDVEQTALEAEELILNRSGVTNLQYSVGGENPLSPGPSRSDENDTEDFGLEKERLLQALQEVETPGEWGAMEMGGGLGGSNLSLAVYGDTIEEIQPIVDQIVTLVEADDSFEKVEMNIRCL